MWLFWNVPIDNIAYDHLNYSRWELVLASISGLSMSIVLVRTYKHSGYPYLYTCAAMMFLASLFDVLTFILYNWAILCP
jgi:VanZ family protein